MKTTKAKPQRGRIKRYIESGGMIVVLEVPTVYAPESPEEPLLEARTIKLLDEAQRRADAGDRPWLRKHGRIYESGMPIHG